MLVIDNIRVTPPTVPGGTGSVLFDVTGNTVSTGQILAFCPASPGDPTPPGGAVLTAHALPALNLSVTAGAFAPNSTWQIAVFEDAPSNLDAYASFLMPVYTATPVLGCTDPSADNYDPAATQDDGSCAYTPLARTPWFKVPIAQSLRFVHPGAVIPFDNQHLATGVPADTTNPAYAQLVERADTLVLQYQTNYTGTQTVQLVGGASPISFTPAQVVVGQGTSPLFDAYARPDALASNTRIYFNDDALPLPFLPGQRVTITGAGSLNGTYPIADVREDAAAAVPYLLLSRAYPGGSQRIDLTLTTPYALQAFDTWQVVIPFSAVAVGCYTCVITVQDTDFTTATAESEPIQVRTTHRDTVLIAYRNFDNAFDLNYTVGLVNRIRVKGRLFDRQTPTQKTTLRSSNNRLDVISAEAQRKIPLRVYLEPGFRHEALALAFCHDLVRVDGLEVVAPDDYTYPPVSHYSLANGDVLLEQKDFLQGNRDDVGDVDGGPYLLVDDQYLKINP